MRTLGKDCKLALKAFKWFGILRRRFGDPNNLRDLEYPRYNASLDDLVDSENSHRSKNGVELCDHKCDQPLCNGNVPSYSQGLADGLPLAAAGQDRVNAVVMDGIQTLTHVVCSQTGCQRAPVNNRKKFCKKHEAKYGPKCAARLSKEEIEGGLVGDKRGFCTNNHLTSKQCCLTHQQVESEFGKPAAYYRQVGRRQGESHNEWHHKLTEFAKKRNQHRFTRHYMYGYMFLISPCGHVLDMLPLYSQETSGDSQDRILDWLDKYVQHCAENGKKVSYVLYDRSCFIAKRLFGANGPELEARWPYVFGAGGPLFLVDRFHYNGHATRDLDPTCVDFCNPYDVQFPGLTKVLEK